MSLYKFWFALLAGIVGISCLASAVMQACHWSFIAIVLTMLVAVFVAGPVYVIWLIEHADPAG
jgi:hypothetical protein